MFYRTFSLILGAIAMLALVVAIAGLSLAVTSMQTVVSLATMAQGGIVVIGYQATLFHVAIGYAGLLVGVVVLVYIAYMYARGTR